MDATYLLKLIQREGFYNLAGSDGCLCAHVLLHGVMIDVTCQKSSCKVCPHGVCIHISGGPEITRSEASLLAEQIKSEIEPMIEELDVHVVYESGTDAE